MRVLTVRPIQRNEFAANFHPVAATRSANVPRIMLLVTSKNWAISGRSTAASNCNYGATHAAFFFDVRSQNRRRLFSCFRYTDVMCAQYRCWYPNIFSDTGTESIPAVSADTEYPMPVSVSPYVQPIFACNTSAVTRSQKSSVNSI